MRCIIAGTRTITDYKLIEEAVNESGFVITEVVSGGATGADQLGETWAFRRGVPIKLFEANWKKYGSRAGPIRNKEMADYAESCILVWSGKAREVET